MNNVNCVRCGKTRQAHYDMKYCYAAIRHITQNNTTYVFPITDLTFLPQLGLEPETCHHCKRVIRNEQSCCPFHYKAS